MKKIVALLMVLVLVSVSALAFAADSPKTQNVTKVTTGTTVEVEVVETEETEEVAAVVVLLTAIQEAIAAGKPVISVYDESTQDAIAELVEDTSKLELIEIVALNMDNYEDGKVTLTMDFAEKFAADQKVIVVITADGVDYPCEGTITEAGKLELALTEDVAAAVAAAKVVIAAVFLA